MKHFVRLGIFISLFIFLFQIPASSQQSEGKCFRKCARQAKKELKDCKKLTKQCIKQNASDPLTVLDYCTDSFVGACESTVNDTYTACLTDVCGLDLVQYRNDVEFDELTGMACSTDGGSVVNPLLTDIENIVNKGWETAACQVGLCPYGSSSDPVFQGKIAIGCDVNAEAESALDAYCVTVNGGVCDGFHVDTTVESIDGLQDLVFANFQVSTVTGAAGTQTCPYKSDAEGGSFKCSYYGTGTGSASLQSGTEIKLVDSDFEVKVKCNDGFENPTSTVYKGSFTCKTSNPTATVEFDLCAGKCLLDPLKGVMTYLQIPSKKDLKLKAGDLTCDFDPDTNPESWFLDAFVPLFEDTIASALRAPITDVINDVIPDMPYPGMCPAIGN